jgi:hypothetical protein
VCNLTLLQPEIKCANLTLLQPESKCANLNYFSHLRPVYHNLLV